jgi:folate-binding protein YgfZ
MPERAEITRQYGILQAGAGWRWLDDRIVVRISGDDRVSFLHGMCTADIKGLQPGVITPALFLTDRAHLLADCFIYCLDDAILIEIDRSLWTPVREHLEKFLVADDVEMEEPESLRVVDCEGATAVDAVAPNLSILLEPWRFETAVMIANLPRLGASAYTILVEERDFGAQTAHLAASGLIELAPGTLEVARVEHGCARVGVDTSGKTLALEARLERAIAFDKGCYLGQETIERATARGGVKRKLCGLRIEGETLPEAGSEIILDGKPIGSLTSVVWSPMHGVIGLAIVHHAAWAEGTRLRIAGGGGGHAARIAELPFDDR